MRGIGKKRSPVLLGVAIVAALAVTFGALHFTEMPHAAAFTSGIFVLAALLWATEALPLFATSLLVIGLQVVMLANPGGWHFLGTAASETTNWRTIFGAAADPVLMLFFGGFLLARAAVKEGVDRAMSSLLLRPFGGEPRWIMLGLMLVTALFSMWMSNTATTAMMMTLVVPMLSQMPMALPISTPPNAIAYAQGEFTPRDIARIGIIIGFVGAVLIVAGSRLVLSFWTIS